ncbi:MULTISPECIES: hypothetical protein [Azohydromonas]|jgi:hypothetical protein|uniref:Uncharacterized protein n=1 Tax=Azohydromonas lata TaxID=45677 RepID=A0ABU5I9G2_9BURK|nr:MULTISPECIES: hypothetical protein [Azohydromonas]MDZ5455743.1 hypothetical protein [Azohydromonas lata]
MASWSCTAAVAVLIAVPALAAAQGAATPAAPQPVYRSTFEGYRAFTDEPVRPWRETNDTVGRIGGWKAYAREIQAPDARPAAASASAPVPDAAGGSHSNHHAPAKP